MISTHPHYYHERLSFVPVSLTVNRTEPNRNPAWHEAWYSNILQATPGHYCSVQFSSVAHPTQSHVPPLHDPVQWASHCWTHFYVIGQNVNTMYVCGLDSNSSCLSLVTIHWTSIADDDDDEAGTKLSAMLQSPWFGCSSSALPPPRTPLNINWCLQHHTVHFGKSVCNTWAFWTQASTLVVLEKCLKPLKCNQTARQRKPISISFDSLYKLHLLLLLSPDSYAYQKGIQINMRKRRNASETEMYTVFIAIAYWLLLNASLLL